MTATRSIARWLPPAPLSGRPSSARFLRLPEVPAPIPGRVGHGLRDQSVNDFVCNRFVGNESTALEKAGGDRIEIEEDRLFDRTTGREALTGTGRVWGRVHPLPTTSSLGRAMRCKHPRLGPPTLHYFLPARIGPPRAKGTGP